MAFIAVGDKRIAETNPDLTPYALQEDVNNEFENVVYKTDIAKTIDVDSTDEEVASAKAVYTELEAKADKDYGIENKGKMLVVGEDGTIVPDEPTLSTVAMTKNAWQIYDKSKLKDGQEVIITDDDAAGGVIDDSATRGDATWSSSKISDSLVDLESELGELEEKVGHSYELDGGYRYGQIVYDYTEQRYVGLFQLSPYEAKDDNIIQDFAVVSYSTYAIEKYKKYGTSLLVYPQKISANITSGFLCRIQIIKNP